MKSHKIFGIIHGGAKNRYPWSHRVICDTKKSCVKRPELYLRCNFVHRFILGSLYWSHSEQFRKPHFGLLESLSTVNLNHVTRPRSNKNRQPTTLMVQNKKSPSNILLIKIKSECPLAQSLDEHPRAQSAEREVHFKGGTRDLKKIVVNFELCGFRKKESLPPPK